MVFRRRQDRQASGSGAEPPATAGWPEVTPEAVPRLDALLQKMCSTDDLEALGRLVTGLQELSGTSILDQSRSAWTWLAAFAADATLVPPIVKLRLAFFCDIWNENVRSQAYAWGLALGYPSEDEAATIHQAALDYSGGLAPETVVAQGDTVGQVRAGLAQRLGLPLPAASGTPAAGLEVLGKFNQVFDDARAGDAASHAYATGITFAANGDDATAIPHLEEAAQLGLVDAMYDAGCAHRRMGNDTGAVFWWEAAAEAGHLDAASNLGVFESGRGNRSRAEKWFAELADHEDPRGYRGLAQLANEAGDPPAALQWVRRGAEAGDVVSMVEYSRALGTSSSGNPDILQESLRWAERAAHSGSADGMFLAGLSHAMLGSHADAGFWLSQAEMAGHPRAGAVKREQGL